MYRPNIILCIILADRMLIDIYSRTLLYVIDTYIVINTNSYFYFICNDIDVTHTRCTFKILDIMINVYRLVYIRNFYCSVYSL